MVEIRRAGPADTGELLTVQRAAWVTEAQLHDAPSMPPLTETREEIVRAVETQTVLVALDGHRLVGAVRAHARERVWHVGRLGVAPDRQGEGIGSRLLRAVEELAPDDVDAFELFTGPRSAHNVRLYERHGYRVVPSDDGLIHLTKPRRRL
ncbi:MAG TPA: GNAT family N-acetyltransferase [Jatrophihabitantaceae bacterium]